MNEQKGAIFLFVLKLNMEVQFRIEGGVKQHFIYFSTKSFYIGYLSFQLEF